jgi:hypothetical protein
METSLGCPSSVEIVDLSSGLLLFSGLSEGIFSRVTMTSMTGNWYQPLTPVETLLVGLVVLQVL